MEVAERLASELVELNQSRKEMTLLGYERAVEQIQAEHLDKDSVMILCLEGCLFALFSDQPDFCF